CQQHNNYPHSF
nr:immunoglobulin light chain junction region [Macaca mulatta]MOV63833.1 immunoglobulin light chain junction region [Macaca mulatta]MOV65424.1 immunoglobulin light chain junction region [Macaca mulatta]MOV65526.1 immunoglobulin light chain junction region [Macaca mulatta]MOX52642.1 immunoglobulin light chain junction region [Macaca mulatta]